MLNHEKETMGKNMNSDKINRELTFQLLKS